MTDAVLGTANLFGPVDVATSRAVLREAVAVGYHRIDTAPSYGHGDSEPAVGELARDRPELAISTKVGIEAVPAPSTALRLAKAAARRLPAPLQQRLRGGSAPGHGRFAIEDVARSLDRSLARLPRIDRLLLHEPDPQDITPELVTLLRAYRDDGRIASLGVAGANDLAAPCLDRSPGLFDVVHLAVGPGAVVPDLPAAVRRVGHGALGPGAAGLRAVLRRLDSDARWTQRWHAELRAAGLDADTDPATVLIGRAVARGPDELIVATSRPARLAGLRSAVTDPVPVGAELSALIDLA